MLNMDIDKSFQTSLDTEFSKLAGDPNFSGQGTEVMKGRSDYKEVNEKWSEKYKKSIDCKNPKGFSQRAHCQGKKKKENKEATSAGSAGQYSAPLFSELNEKEIKEVLTKIDNKKLEKIIDTVKHNDTKAYEELISMILDLYPHDYDEIEQVIKKSNKKTQEKVSEKLHSIDQELKGKHTIEDIVEKHLKKGQTYSKVEKQVKSNLKKGIKVEMEHTDNEEVAKKIALDHLYEDLDYYDKLKKIETKEATGASSSGQYSTPKMWAKSMKKKDWRGANKTQIPGGKFVTVKEKCRKFPYCNQGDIKALNIFENERLNKVISMIESKYKIPKSIIVESIIYELNKNK